MTSAKILIVAIISLVVLFVVIVVAADDCNCNAEPDGGWGAPDYTDNPSWGSSFDDLTGGGGSSTDTGGTGGGVSDGEAADSSSGDASGSSGGSGSDGSSSDSGSSSSIVSGSSEEGVVWRMKADDLAERGLYNESLEAYDRSISFDPYTLRSWLGKGKVLLSLDLPSEASEAFTRALRLDPGNTEALTLLGDAKNATGDYDGAIENYVRALAMNPHLASVKDRITQAELAKAAISAPSIPDETVPPVETAVISNSMAENKTMQTSPSETPAAPPTLSASFPGISVILLACGAGLLLLSGKRR